MKSPTTVTEQSSGGGAVSTHAEPRLRRPDGPVVPDPRLRTPAPPGLRVLAAAEHGPDVRAAPVPIGLRAAWPALALYAVLRAVGLVVLWGFAAGSGREVQALLGAYDAAHYAGIVVNGYDQTIPVKPDGTLATTNLAFFPLYPALVALVDPVLPARAATAGILTSWVAGLLAAWALYAVGAQLGDRRVGIALAGLWAVVPHAVVQSMGYTETLFTALAAGSLVAVLRHSWLTAGLLCLLAGLTRPTGAAVIAAVAAAALVAVVRRRAGWRALAAVALAPVGLLLFVGWVGHRLGRLDGYLHLQRDAWRSSYDGGGYTLRTLGEVLTEPQQLARYVTTAVLVIAVALAVLLVADRPPWPMLVYTLGCLALVIGAEGYYHAKARLLMPAFPLLLPLATALAAARPRTAIVVFTLLAVVSAWYGAYLCLDWNFSP